MVIEYFLVVKLGRSTVVDIATYNDNDVKCQPYTMDEWMDGCILRFSLVVLLLNKFPDFLLQYFPCVCVCDTGPPSAFLPFLVLFWLLRCREK